MENKENPHNLWGGGKMIDENQKYLKQRYSRGNKFIISNLEEKMNRLEQRVDEYK